MEAFNGVVWTLLVLYTAVKFAKCVRMVPTQSAYIVERLGKYHTTLGPGFHLLVPFIDVVRFIRNLREEAIEVPPQMCFTQDNVQVEVDGVLYMSVTNPVAASYGVTDYRFAAIQLAQTTTRSVLGTLDLDRTFEERDAINTKVVRVLGEVGQTWGMRVHRYEVKNIIPPPSVRDAMERQMGAERDRRALLAQAEGQKRTAINNSEGRKTEAINKSEGEKQRRINEAQGRAAEILALAKATAESIEKMGNAIAQEGGVEAMNLRLGQSYLTKLGALGHGQANIMLAADLTSVDALLSGMGLSLEDVGADAARQASRGVLDALAAPPRGPGPQGGG
jgi:regulator of protease activity HflC (stomatin/prohibitin superfamily)